MARKPVDKETMKDSVDSENPIIEDQDSPKTYTTYLDAVPACPICHRRMSGPMGAIDSQTYQCLNSDCDVFKSGYAFKIAHGPEVILVEAFKL